MGSIAVDYAGLFPVLDESEGKASITVQTLSQDVLERAKTYTTGEDRLVAFLQTVWALVLREYVESDSVCFAFCHESGIQTCHLSVSPGDSISDLCNRGGQLSPSSSMPEYNTGLLVSKGPPKSDPAVLLDELRKIQDKPQTVLLALEGDVQGPRRLVLLSDTTVISSRKAFHLATAVSQFISQITTNSSRNVAQLWSVSALDEQTVRNWNVKKCRDTNEASILDTIRAKTLEQPNITAICAPDEEWTYAELDTASTQLAFYLHTQGVGPDVFVPLLFQRCPWVIVAQLAVLKAGGAFVPLEPAHPDGRLKEIIRHANSGFLLASETLAHRAAGLIGKVVCLGPSLMSSLATEKHEGVLPPPQPNTPAYVLFTSGSTGQPKGCVVEHKAMATIPEQTQVECMGLSTGSRALQFASYTFAISIFEIYYSLCTGATLCIPFDHDRINNLPGVLESMQITWACITPTLLRSLDANKPPSSLRRVLIGGEPIRKGEFNAWAARVDLVYMYGASEVSGAIGFCPHRPDGAAFVSFPTMRFWITDAADQEKLKPVGATGELVLESNSLGQRYLNSPEATSAAFIAPPSWRTNMAFNDSGPLPLYKTGDLFRYELDGSVRYVGRKGTQVKIRGQRLDLGEVEFHVRKSCPRTARVVVETASPADANGDLVLVAFLYSVDYIPQQTEPSQDVFFAASSEAFRSDVQLIQDKLVSILPSHMLPASYLPLASLPLTVTGKVNRRALRERVQQYTRGQLTAYQSAGPVELVEPATELETRLHNVFAEVLGLDKQSFGVLHGFVSLGGDSVAAMRAVKLCRDRGYPPLAVADVLAQQTARKLAEHLESTQPTATVSTASLSPFSLVRKESQAETESLIASAAEQCKVPVDAVEDIYPCTALQEGLLVSTIKVHGMYIARSVFDVPFGVDLNRLQTAWQTTVNANVTLRTRIIQTSSDGLLQTVIGHDHSVINWQHYPSVEAYYEEDGALPMGLGQPLARFSIIGDASSGLSLGLTIHHAIFDMHSLRLLLEQTKKAYDGHPLSPNIFSQFIRSIQEYDTSSMQEFWKKTFSDMQAPVFPSLPHEMAMPKAAAHLDRTIRLPPLAGTSVTLSNVARLAWAIVVSHHADSEDVVFGVTVNGRAAPVPGIEEMTGPTIATVPFRVFCHPGDKISDALWTVQSLALDMIPFEQAGLQNIRRVSPEAAAACDFQSQLIFQSPQESTPTHSNIMTSQTGTYGLDDYSVFINYVLGLLCTPTADNSLHVRAQYDPDILPEVTTNRLVTQFAYVLQQLCVSQDQRIEQLELVSPEEMVILKRWNTETLLDAHIHTLHDMVLQNVQETPLAPAVSSWDQQLTYQDLERLSARVGQQIIQAGVRPGDRVGLCFEKSSWSVVSMLATLRTGAAAVNIDPALPQGRINLILQVSQPTIVLTSAGLLSRLEALGSGLPLLEVSSTTTASTKTVTRWSSVQPQDTAFILFTSGTTGTPKGIVIEHQNLTTAFWHHRKAFAAYPGMRTLHFCSYAWDMSLEEVFLTWVHGGCLCIPSETQRMSDLAGFIREHQVNWAVMTPSASTILTPDEVPSLKTLILIGESIPMEIMDVWSSRIRLINAYGPAEAACACASSEIQPGKHRPGHFGRMIGSAGWVTMPNDVNRLAPLGAVGELLIEGPMVTREYFHEREKTQQAYITPSTWLQKIRSGGPSYRVFRSGDLVRYEEDGSLVYVGRKDTQVKLRGQRIVLGEIEHQVQLNMPSAQQVVAEVIRPRHNAAAFLAAFIYEGADIGDQAGDQLLRTPDKDLTQQSASMTARLQEVLPAHMVPAAVFPLSCVPQTATGKLDRRQLRQAVEWLSPDQLQYYMVGDGSSEGPKEPPSTPSEMLWQQLWAQALSIPAARIGRDDHLFRMGGDSLTAMKLVALARREGLSHLTFQDVFKCPRLKDIALLSGTFDSICPDQRASAPAPFALVQDPDSLVQVASEQCGVSVDQIEDIYPCTPLQASLVASTVHRRDAYLALKCYILEDGINIERLRRAWESAAAAHAILRTRIIQTTTGASYQVVLKTGSNWSYQEADNPIPTTPPMVGLGTPLVHLTLFPGRLLLSIHHALYDGWSLPLLAGEVDKAYRGLPLQPQTLFNSFIAHVESTLESASSFWKEELQDTNPVHFPVLPLLNYQPKPQSSMDEAITLPENPMPVKATMASKVKLAWALTTSSYTKSQDVVFGVVSSGRTAPVAGIEAMLGPTIATIPTRVPLDSGQSVSEALQEVQSKSAVQMKYEHLGLQRISQLGEQAAAACQFQTLIVIQSPQDEDQPKQSWFRHDKYLSDPNQFSSHALLLQCQPFPEGNIVKVHAIYDTDVLPTAQMRRVLSQFAHFLTQLHAITEMQVVTIGDLGNLTPQDLKELLEWNSLPAKSTPEDDSGSCVHRLIYEKCHSQPDAVAIDAWDGQLTYRQLDDHVARLTQRIQSFDTVRPDSFVALYFEKSFWTVVAQLAVLRAGGAFTMLEPSQPAARLRDICNTVRPVLILSSDSNRDCAAALFDAPVVRIGSVLLDQPGPGLDVFESRVSPSQAMYAVATSGTTGKPKVVVIEHKSFIANIKPMINRLGLTPDSRMFQFIGYSFDPMVFDHFLPLLAGGCICIPSQFDRDNRLERVITEMRANVVQLTTSVIQLLSPSAVPTLRTVILGGEPMQPGVVDCWTSHVQLINAYGPAEATVCACANNLVRPESNPNNIGRNTGGACWIVDPESLAPVPIGAEGEFIIEGSIVARGYLNDPERTAASFIPKPRWLASLGGRGKHASVYRTGDIVRYAPDGSIIYIRRKDSQVKLRGQRVELGEVAYHVQQCFPDAAHVVAAVATLHNTSAAVLVALVLSRSVSAVSSDDHDFLLPASSNLRFQKDAEAAEAHLQERVPAYMVPSVFIPVSRVPCDPNGKVDRRLIDSRLSSLTQQEVANYTSSMALVPPQNDLQHAIREIWATVLNKDSDQIGVQSSFFRIGGDSITSMQVVAQCTSAGIPITMQDMFKHRTIERLAAHTTRVEQTALESEQHELLDTPVALSPIQQMFLDHVPDHPNHFNQSFFLRLDMENLNSESVSHALDILVDTHSMLRARFQVSPEGKWTQIIPTKANGSKYQYQNYRVQSQDRIEAICRTSQRSLDIRNGPVFIADQFEREDDGTHWLYLVAHHLVVDLVSWRVMLADLEQLLTTGLVPKAPPMPFLRWCQLQGDYICQKPSIPDEKVEEKAPTAYWGDEATKHNTHQDVDEYTISLDKETSQALLTSANDALGTQSVEIVQAAVLHSFVQLFPDRPAPVIFCEGHGREPWTATINLTRTVGWFTTAWPTTVDLTATEDAVTAIRRTKDARRRMPANGWEYFTSRYLHPQGPKRIGNVEIMMNYQGQFQQLERTDSVLKLDIKNQFTAGDAAEDMTRWSLLDVSALVIDDRLRLQFVINRHMYHQDRLQSWPGQCERTMREMASQLCAMGERRYHTVSDFPLLSAVASDEFNGFMSGILPKLAGPVEDIYPTAPIQQGMLMSQARHPEYYQNVLRWKVGSGKNAIDIQRLVRAWQRVVDRHAALRTVFVEISGESSQQLVLKHAPARIRMPGGSTEYGDSVRPSPLLKIQTSERNEITVELHINHALFDGPSSRILQRDLILAYGDQLPPTPAPSYGEYIAYLQAKKMSGHDDKVYWCDYLSSAAPCLVPRMLDDAEGVEKEQFGSIYVNLCSTPVLEKLCEDHGLAITSVFHVAWAAVLQCYTGSPNVCFGHLATGRSAPVPGIQDMVGPVTNFLLAQIQLQSDAPVLSVLQQYNNDLFNSLEHQHYSLAQTLHAIGQSADELFNTAISVQDRRKDPAGAELVSDLELINASEEDRSEYPLSLNVAVFESTTELLITHQTSFISQRHAKLIGDTVAQVMSEVLSHPTKPIGELEFLNTAQRSHIISRNSVVPEAVTMPVHYTIHEHCIRRPDAEMVCAGDGRFTATQLDHLSSILAEDLIDHGVTVGDPVPIYIEKTRWTPVAILGVLKSGGAFVLLDASHPPARLRSIYEETGASLILASTKYLAKAADLTSSVIEVGDRLLSAKISAPCCPPVRVRGDSAAYYIFTSGSTGRPKGIITTHTALATSLHHLMPKWFLTPDCRMLQFASNAFDMSIAELVFPLLAGGCVCIPSDEERTGNITGAINRMRVNWITSTPTVARLFNPDELKHLETISFGGEAVSPSDLAMWTGKARVLVTYGPSETAMVSTVTEPMTTASNPRSIGHPTGSVAWVVDRDNHHRLVPDGVVGELLIEGPIVAHGYLHNAEKSAAAFVEPPTWLATLRRGGPPVRLYKTGDLVHRAQDGSLIFVGRKDNQIKIRGQRLELGEVEVQVSRVFPGSHVLVELVKDSSSPFLVAYILQERRGRQAHTTPDGFLYLPSEEFANCVRSVLPSLHEIMPSYMIPSAFLPLVELPKAGTGKTDRKRLQEYAASLAPSQLEAYSATSTARRIPNSPLEAQLQELVAKVLGRSPDIIPLDEDVFQVGMDSMKGMFLAAETRHVGLKFSVPMLFQHPRLCDLAVVMEQQKHEEATVLPPSALLAFADELCVQWDLDRSLVENIIPTTYYQRESVAAHHIAHATMHFAQSVDMERLQRCMTMAIERHSILRGVFVPFQGRYVQIVLRHVDLPVQEIHTDEDPKEIAESICRVDAASPVPFGKPTLCLLLIMGRGRVSAALRLNHAQYDGMSIHNLINDIKALYEAPECSLPPRLDYQDFIAHRTQRTTTSVFQFWRDVLHGSSVTHLAPYDPTIGRPDKSRLDLQAVSSAQIPMPDVQGGVTMATVVKAAWSLTLMQYNKIEDAVFVQVSSNRMLPIDGIDRTVGPCVNYVPVRVTLQKDWTARQLFHAIQNQHIRAMSQDTADWDDIVAQSTSWDPATPIGTGVHYLNAPPLWNSDYSFATGVQARNQHIDFKMLHNYPVMMCVPIPARDGVPEMLNMALTSPLFSQEVADHLLSLFRDAVLRLTANPEEMVSNLVQ